MFITFEGLDFCGKSTQANLLAARLRRHPLPGEGAVRPVRFLREPGGTRISERLRDILLDRRNLELSETTELMLFAASRAQLVTEVIRPALRAGETVICDRYVDSTTVYQGYGRGLDLQAIRHINRLVTEGLAPDVTIVVDVDLDEIEKRRREAGLASDRMESSGRAFYERVRNGYRELSTEEPDRVVRVNGMESVSAVEDAIWQILQKHSAKSI
jgi:dTMP kinase